MLDTRFHSRIFEKSKSVTVLIKCFDQNNLDHDSNYEANKMLAQLNLHQHEQYPELFHLMRKRNNVYSLFSLPILSVWTLEFP